MAFALGWLASRLDLRQWKRAQQESPRAYFKGLNLLLNEQQDKAIDAFIEAVQNDPDTTELHFALGNLFRRRGEYERAVRVHEHLLQRADLPAAERERAQHDGHRAGELLAVPTVGQRQEPQQRVVDPRELDQADAHDDLGEPVRDLLEVGVRPQAGRRLGGGCVRRGRRRGARR